MVWTKRRIKNVCHFRHVLFHYESTLSLQKSQQIGQGFRKIKSLIQISGTECNQSLLKHPDLSVFQRVKKSTLKYMDYSHQGAPSPPESYLDRRWIEVIHHHKQQVVQICIQCIYFKQQNHYFFDNYFGFLLKMYKYKAQKGILWNLKKTRSET